MSFASAAQEAVRLKNEWLARELCELGLSLEEARRAGYTMVTERHMDCWGSGIRNEVQTVEQGRVRITLSICSCLRLAKS